MNKKKCFEGGKEVPEDLKECSTFGYPFDKDFAEFKLKERKAIKWLRYGICGSILIVILVLVVIHILGNRNKDYRSEEIIKYLQENEVSFSKEETTNTSKHEGYIKFEDDGDCTVKLHYNYWNGDYVNLAGDAEYSVVYDFWGKEYLKLNIKWYKDTSVWEMLVGIDEKGNIIALKNKNENAYIDTEIENKNIPIIYRNSQDIIYFIVVLVIAIVVCGMLIINVFTIQKSYKIRTKEKKLKLQQDKINTEKEKLAAEWDEKTKLLGYTVKNYVYLSYGDYLWIFNNNIYESENKDQYIKRYLGKNNLQHELLCKSIPVSNIQYFSKEGDIQYTTKISGGGGGGSSISGAIVGGLIAGETGAVVGSRKKVQEVKSEVVKHDSRCTIIRYYKDQQMDVLRYSGEAVYDYLLKMIPEKDLLTIQLKDRGFNKEDTDSIDKKLQTIKNLYENELITKKEYEKKKGEILSKI